MHSIADSISKKCASVIAALRQQAPAARMVGRFAVKQASDEIDKRLRPRSDDNDPHQNKQ
jgi:hypothetical protein